MQSKEEINKNTNNNIKNSKKVNGNANSTPINSSKPKEKPKDTMHDEYFKQLSSLLFKIEEIYDVNTVIEEGISLHKLPIYEFAKYITADVRKLSNREKVDKNIRVGALMASISYINSRLKFMQIKKLDFTVFGGMNKLLGTLEKFLYKETSTKRALLELNGLLNILKHREEKSVNCTKTLAYRYLRLFYILIAYDNRVEASIIADLILNQIKIGTKDRIDDGKMRRA